MYLLRIGMATQQLNNCKVNGCTNKGVVKVGNDKMYCANCYTFVVSAMLKKGRRYATP